MSVSLSKTGVNNSTLTGSEEWLGRNLQGNVATSEKPFLRESRFQDLQTVTTPSRGDSPYLDLVFD